MTQIWEVWNMLVNSIVFLFLCSGSVFCAARFNQKFERTMPITALGSILVIFLCGVCGHLKTGVAICFALAAAMYFWSVGYLVKFRRGKEWLSRMLTPGFAIFVLAFGVLSYANYGRMAVQYDEFSHWADIVKVMTLLDDYGTNPASNSMFPQYPPGMAIFQYLFQVVGKTLISPDFFNEGLLYFAFQLFIVILMLPFFEEVSFRNLFQIVALAVAAFVAPLLMARFVYRDIYIDPVLGFLSGVGFSLILVCRNKDKFYSLNIWLLCSGLVLFKDVGKMFAVFLLLAYCLDMALDGSKPITKMKIIHGGIGLLFTFMPVFLWKWEVKSSHCVIHKFSEKLDVLGFLRVVVGKDTTYRTQVLHNYLEALTVDEIPVGHLPIQMDYYTMMLLLVVFSAALCWFYWKKEPEKGRARALVISTALIQMVVYIIGLAAAYMFKFLEGEALELAAMERYIKMEWLSNWVVISLLAVFAVLRWGNRALCIGFMVVCFLITPVKELYNLAAQKNMDAFGHFRFDMEPLRYAVQEYCDGDDTVLFVCEGDPEVYNVMFNFNTRPNKTEYAGYLFYNNQENRIDELRGSIESGCNYVALFRMRDTFTEYYGELFANPEEIAESALFRVDEETGLLHLCQ